MAATPITRSRLRRLADVRPARGRVLSVFLNLEPAEFSTPAARSTAVTSVMTEAAHRAASEPGLEHDEREALRADVERVREVLSGGDLAANGARAVAVYACAAADLLEVVSLRHALPSRVVIDESPFVEPLVREGTGERWCVLLVNRRVARLFTGTGHDLQETDRVEDDVHSQHEQGGWSQSRYQRGVEKEKDDHLAHTAEVAFTLYKRRGFDRLLVGAPDELVPQLEARLHPYLRERAAGRLHLDVEHASLDAVRRAAGEAIEEHVRCCEREALDRLAEAVGRGERGAAGLDAVLAALGEARVETLLIAADLDADTAEPAIEQAIEQSATVIAVRHHDDLGPLGGIGAVLRY